MPDAREMAQEYAKAGLGVVFVMNGGAAVAVLSQASDLIAQGLGDDVGWALLIWAVGVALVPTAWLFGFLSLRHVDRSTEQGAAFGREIALSNRYMAFGMWAFGLAVILFIAGSITLAKALMWVVVPEAAIAG